MPVRLSLGKIGKHAHIRILRSYRNADGSPRNEMVATWGRMDEALAKNPHVIEEAKRKVEELNSKESEDRFSARSANAQANIQKAIAEAAQGANTQSQTGLNIGVAVIQQLWNKLHLEDRFRYLQTKTNIEYDYPSLAFMSTAMRMLAPSSRLQAWNHRENYVVDFGALSEISHYYRVLEQLSRDKENIVKMLNYQVQDIYKREVTVCLYDVTTYAFESRTESELRGFGISKDHKVNEVQVVLGLVIDSEGIPIDYELFNGNQNEFATLIPTIRRVIDTYKVKRLVVVADRGLNSSENLWQLSELGCDFVIAQKIRNCSESLQQEILNEHWDMHCMELDSSGTPNGVIVYKAKTLEVPREIKETRISASGRRYPGKKTIGTLDTYWVVTHSASREKKDLADLDRAVEKAQKCLKEGRKKSERGWSSLIQYPKGKGKAKLDIEKIDNKRRWAGYYAICTNMDIAKKNPKVVQEIYRQLWRIEDSFRITKTGLEARPIFVWNDDRINGHFVVCYMALVLERLLEYECRKNSYQVTTPALFEALRTAMVVPVKLREGTVYLKLNVNDVFERVSSILELGTLNKIESQTTLRTKLHLKRKRSR